MCVVCIRSACSNLLCSFFSSSLSCSLFPTFKQLSHGYYGASPTHQVHSWTNAPWTFCWQDHGSGWQCVASQRRVCLCLGLGFETRHQKVNTTYIQRNQPIHTLICFLDTLNTSCGRFSYSSLMVLHHILFLMAIPYPSNPSQWMSAAGNRIISYTPTQ